MKRFKIYPKIFVHHFKKRPSRIITWFSILAVVIALVITNFKLDQIIPRAHAAEIKIEGDKITLFGETNRSNFFTTADNYKILLNDFMIDVDGYLQARWYPDPTNRLYGFEYVYVRNDNGAIRIKPDAGERIKFDSTKNLVISADTRVYMEGNQDRPLNLKSLTIDGAGATLIQVPANRDGLAAPFSTNNYWGVQFFGYYYLGPNRKVAFQLPNDGNDNYQALRLGVSEGVFNPLSEPDSPWGKRYGFDGVSKNCWVTDRNRWCGNGSAVEADAVWFENNTSQGKFLALDFVSSVADSDRYEIRLYHHEKSINPDNQIAKDDVPIHKFVGLHSDGSGAPAAAPGNNADLPASNQATIAFGYYFDAFGVKQNHFPLLALSIPDKAPRSFQALSVNLYNDGSGGSLYDFAVRKNTNVFYAGSNRPAFRMLWRENGRDANQRGNPISYSIMEQGEDYLRAPLAGYVQNKLVGENNTTQRQARINLNIADNVTITNGGAIDISGKGFPGGISSVSNYNYPNSQWSRYFNKEDNPIHGAGFGGGAGGWTEAEPYVYSGSYGGAGVFTRQTYNVVENNAYPALAGNVYGGGEKIYQPTSLGSGGGYYRELVQNEDDIAAAVGGAGGGALKIITNTLSIDSSSSIKANGGNGFVGVPGKPDPMAETRGVLGKPGIKMLVGRPLNDNQWTTKYRGTAGSGGSIWLKINDEFNNQGTIEARGAEGAVRFKLNEDPTEGYNKYFNASRDYTSDGLSILKCANNDSANCQGPGAGGGRIAINYRLIANRGNLWAWGGGVSDLGSEQTDSQNSLDLVGTAGSVVQENAVSDLIFSNISIDKSVNLCKNGEDSCKDDAGRDVDFGNANAQNGAWMLVQIRLINNTGVDKSNITVTDEKFDYATNINKITTEGTWFTNANEVGWNNISMTIGQEKTLEYYFQINLVDDN